MEPAPSHPGLLPSLSLCAGCWVLVSSVKLGQRLQFTPGCTRLCSTPPCSMSHFCKDGEDDRLLIGRKSKAALGTLGETIRFIPVPPGSLCHIHNVRAGDEVPTVPAAAGFRCCSPRVCLWLIDREPRKQKPPRVLTKGGAASPDEKRKDLEKWKWVEGGVLSVCQCIRKRPNCVDNTFHLGGERKKNASLIKASQSFKSLYPPEGRQAPQSGCLSDLQALFSGSTCHPLRSGAGKRMAESKSPKGPGGEWEDTEEGPRRSHRLKTVSP